MKISTTLLVITGKRAGIPDGGSHVFVSFVDFFGNTQTATQFIVNGPAGHKHASIHHAVSSRQCHPF